MGVISWIIFGLIAGALAKLILPGDDPGGIIVTILIGIAGALLGGFIGTRSASAMLPDSILAALSSRSPAPSFCS